MASSAVTPTDQPEEDNSFWHQFTQQRLKAFHPVHQPKVVIWIYSICGVIFSLLGAGLVYVSHEVVEYAQDYTETHVDAKTGVGSFEIEIDRDMKPPIFVYYKLDGFHQNHRRYMKSRSDFQMKETDKPVIEPSALQSTCHPWVTTDGRLNYPCGIIARSIFNDTYMMQHRSSPSDDWDLLEVDSSAKTIAWAADTDGKFRNLDPEKKSREDAQNQVHLDMWINQYFPPVECRQINTAKSFVPVQVASRHISDKTGQGTVHITDCKGYNSKEGATCNFTRLGKPFTCKGDYAVTQVKDWGIESGHFIVWMRIAGLPTFMKLWGKVETHLKKGSTLQVQFADNFPVKEFYGRKAFVISTVSPLGGKNDFLGFGYVGVGICCLVFAAGFLWKEYFYPRQMGDISLLGSPN